MTNQQYISAVLGELSSEKFWDVFKKIEKFSCRYTDSKKFIYEWLSDEYNPISIVYTYIGIDASNTKMTPCILCAYGSPSSCDGKPCTICPAR